MYEFTIEKILSTDKTTSKIFLGAFAKNEVPTAFKFPACFIANTQARNRPGQHWLAFYYDSKGTCYFFDSYGRTPNYYNFKSYIQRTAKKCYYTNKRIQGDSYICGLYCVFYLLFKARNKEKIFFSKFTKSLKKNDEYILDNIKQY